MPWCTSGLLDTTDPVGRKAKGDIYISTGTLLKEVDYDGFGGCQATGKNYMPYLGHKEAQKTQECIRNFNSFCGAVLVILFLR